MNAGIMMQHSTSFDTSIPPGTGSKKKTEHMSTFFDRESRCRESEEVYVHNHQPNRANHVVDAAILLEQYLYIGLSCLTVPIRLHH